MVGLQTYKDLLTELRFTPEEVIELRVRPAGAIVTVRSDARATGAQLAGQLNGYQGTDRFRVRLTKVMKREAA